MIYELFKSIESTSSTVEKANLMSASLNDTIKQIYDDTYNNDRKYGVKKYDMPEECGLLNLDEDYNVFHAVLDMLCAREVTGNAAIEMVEITMAKFTAEAKEILACILNKKLTIGLSKTSFDKLLGEDAPSKFEVALAYNLDKVKGVDPLDGTYFASRKCDGCRNTAHVTKNGDDVEIKFVSRQGKEFTTLDNLKPAIKAFVKNVKDGEYVIDGEICKVDANGDEDFQTVMKEVRRKDYTIEDPCYKVFDFVTKAQFEGREKSLIFSKRYELMEKMAKNVDAKTLNLLKQERITSQEDFDRWTGYVNAGNWEGFMLRKDAPYASGRTKDLLKVKKFEDAEYVVEDLEISEMTTSEPGKGNVKFTGVKSLLITHKGNTVNVGSGLSKEQRIAWYKNPKLIIGKTITVQFFEETQNQDGTFSLRFPVLKFVYENGRDA